MKFSKLNMYTAIVAICAIFFVKSANAQQYKTIADTAKLKKNIRMLHQTLLN